MTSVAIYKLVDHHEKLSEPVVSSLTRLTSAWRQPLESLNLLLQHLTGAHLCFPSSIILDGCEKSSASTEPSNSGFCVQ